MDLLVTSGLQDCLLPGVNVIKLFFFIADDDEAKYARVFVTSNHFTV